MTRGLDWAEIFKRRPDLEPPGYRETVEAIRQLHERGDAKKDDRPRKR